jgi:transcriptional regulator with GAF, ATPase, and Fis domain
MLGVPLVAGDRFLGTLIAANREERPFARDDVTLLRAFGDHAAVALENARLYDESRRALHALETAFATKRRSRPSKRPKPSMRRSPAWCSPEATWAPSRTSSSTPWAAVCWSSITPSG